MKELTNVTVHIEGEEIYADHFSIGGGVVNLMDEDMVVRRIVPLSRVCNIKLNYNEPGRVEEPRIGLLEKDEALEIWNHPGEHYDRDYCP